MPYAVRAGLPDSVRRHLPKAAQEIYRATFNSAWKQYADHADREALAHRVAWSAVKHRYEQHGERWVAK
ncbi:MAG: ChaB family protein [Comamonadaceae bacterium]|nr:ChaB family protein [Comamonadaceae bacterium]